MSSNRSESYRLARKIVRPSLNSIPWTPQTPQVSLSQGFITNVNIPNGHADYQFPHPSGNGPIAQAVPFIQPYSPSNPPVLNDLAWAVHVGQLMFLLGAQPSPTNFITP